MEALQRLEYRGYDSAGIAVGNGGKHLELRRATGKLRNLEQAVRQRPLEGKYGIGHTRWATHGRPTEQNAHPHRDCFGQVAVVHNGIVENYMDLKRRLLEEGHRFLTETDTEIIAHRIEKKMSGNGTGLKASLEEAMREALTELRGGLCCRGHLDLRPEQDRCCAPGAADCSWPRPKFLGTITGNRR